MCPVSGGRRQCQQPYLDYQQLRLFEKLLLALRTKIGIQTEPHAIRGRVFAEMLKPYKYGRRVDELISILQVASDAVLTLIDKLKELHLLKEVKRFDDVYIEWTSDYLADLTDFLHSRVRVILLGRMVRSSMSRAESKKQEIMVAHNQWQKFSSES